MALVKCKECGKEVSNTAKVCPHCGVKHPSITNTQTAKGCFGIIGFVVLFATAMALMDDDPAPNVSAQNTPTVAVVDEANAAKWKALAGISDCQLALRVYNDYQPIFAELHSYLTQTNPPTYEQLNNWKQIHRLDERVDALDNKYPSSYQVSMENTQFAKNLSFAIGQYWRDAFARQRSTNNQGPIDSDQPSLMNDDLQLLKQNCPEEFKGF